MRFYSLSILIIAAVSVLGGPATAQWIPDGMVVCAAEGAQYDPQIVSDGEGGSIIVWKDERYAEGYGFVFAQRADISGATLWAEDGVLVSSVVGCEDVRAIADGAGGVILVWSCWITYDQHCIVTQRINPAGETLWTNDGVTVCMESGQPGECRIVGDGAGGAIVAWEQCGVGSDIRAARISADGSLMWENGGINVCDNTSDQEKPTMISDGSGGVIIAWEDHPGGDENIYAQRLDGTGALLWADSGVPVCVAGGWQDSPEVVSDGSGGAIVTWYTYDSPTGDDGVFAQRIGPDGESLWTAGGVAVCSASGSQDYPRIVADGSGGAIIAWEDWRLVSCDIYAQRLSGTGTALWAAAGVPLCVAEHSQSELCITTDGAGGAICAWTDKRRDNGEYTVSDIYAQAVDAAGAVRWVADGIALSEAEGRQYRVQVAMDGAGGAVFTWAEATGDRDIYALRVGDDGFIVDVPASVPVLLHPCRPNPFNPSTTIAFDVPEGLQARVCIFDLAGRLVCRLGDDMSAASGRREVVWSGRDDSGREVPSGVYLCRLQAGAFSASRLMTLVK